MIEALFHRTKHRLLYMRRLADLETLNEFDREYFDHSNHRIPHGGLKGATPFEVLVGEWSATKIE